MSTEEGPPTCSLTRRFLSLPAARPYTDAVSAHSLLRAIIAIAQEITDRSSSYRKVNLSLRFPVQSCREGARRALHVTRLLLSFLEELRASVEEEAADQLLLTVLCELYVAFQKLRILLQDCTLRGGRILVLMRAHAADREFRAFHESVATALDSLCLSSKPTRDDEVAEVAELAGKQAWRAAREAVVADERAAHEVRAILVRLERGLPPRRAALRRVLYNQHVRTWVDCNAEVTFLDGQISLAALDDTGSITAPHMDLLHGIRGLMVYARAVLFDAAESTSSPDGGDSSNCLLPSSASDMSWLDPKGIHCPISLDLMTDPVTVSSGQTYNRASIVRWLRDGNYTCPVTGKFLGGASTDHLVTNLAVQNVIHRFCKARCVKIPAPQSKSQRAAPVCISTNKAAAGAMRLVATHLVRELSEGSHEAQSIAACEAQLLAKSGDTARAALMESGVAPWLLRLLASRDWRTRDAAAAAVMNISKHPRGCKEIFDAGGLAYLVDLLADKLGTSPDSRVNATRVIFYLATADEEYRLAIGEKPRMAQALVDLLKSGTRRGKKHAVAAILALLASQMNYDPLTKAGAMPAMIRLLGTEGNNIVTVAMAAIVTLAERPRGARSILAEPSQIPGLVEVLRSSVPAAAKECCISVLTALCKEGGAEITGYLNRIPTLMPSLFTLLTESTPAASKMASSLIRIIHSGNRRANDPPHFRTSMASETPESPPQLTPHNKHVNVQSCIAV